MDRLPGDELVDADVTMDRTFMLDASPSAVWPWLVQIGKDRAGLYLPGAAERFIPPLRPPSPVWRVACANAWPR